MAHARMDSATRTHGRCAGVAAAARTRDAHRGRRSVGGARAPGRAGARETGREVELLMMRSRGVGGVRAASVDTGVSGRVPLEALKDALRAVIISGDGFEAIERRARELERAYETTTSSSTSDVQALSNGTWRVAFTNAPPPSNGMLGPFKGESFQVVDAASMAYENILAVPPESWLRVRLRARYEALRDVDASGATWKVTFETVKLRAFQRFDVFEKSFTGDATTRIWRTTYVDDNLRIVRAARTMEAIDAARARGRAARAGDDDDCLFVMTREVPWWDYPIGGNEV